MRMPDLPFVDDGDLAIWDTPLHRTIELAHLETSEGELVVYFPTEETAEAYLQSDCFVDTYDAR